MGCGESLSSLSFPPPQLRSPPLKISRPVKLLTPSFLLSPSQWASLFTTIPLDVAKRENRRHGLRATKLRDGSGRQDR